ncbi:hypothetical protein NADFUDRAFT_44061 [Nadsonia fulvescens var. elongata DSM 6958]|uniref:Uncharacterized protein n=1 Tax=Nadsonia fulvescens var. elongata DSM 6958 TaxID=857566 RepID=A0A1E3PFN5_9ASCO|nr:hypothetical protein NADFUDRAFT_44061 [Nadsonia fulvescens var. elongata DSM 6958]
MPSFKSSDDTASIFSCQSDAIFEVMSLDHGQGGEYDNSSQVKLVRSYANATLLWTEAPYTNASPGSTLDKNKSVCRSENSGNPKNDPNSTSSNNQSPESWTDTLSTNSNPQTRTSSVSPSQEVTQKTPSSYSKDEIDSHRVSVQNMRDQTQEMELILTEIQKLRLDSKRLSLQKEDNARLMEKIKVEKLIRDPDIDEPVKHHKNPNITPLPEAHHLFPDRLQLDKFDDLPVFKDYRSVPLDFLTKEPVPVAYRPYNLSPPNHLNYHLNASPETLNSINMQLPPQLPLPPLPPVLRYPMPSNLDSSRDPLKPLPGRSHRHGDPLASRSISYSTQGDIEILPRSHLENKLKPSASLHTNEKPNTSRKSSRQKSPDEGRPRRYRSHSHSHHRHHPRSHSGLKSSNYSSSSKAPKDLALNSPVFSQPSVARLLAENRDNTLADLETLQLPPDERRTIEQFIDTLSKLSIEMSLDDKKRPEGRRRLNNALRALEGWI